MIIEAAVLILPCIVLSIFRQEVTMIFRKLGKLYRSVAQRMGREPTIEEMLITCQELEADNEQLKRRHAKLVDADRRADQELAQLRATADDDVTTY